MSLLWGRRPARASGRSVSGAAFIRGDDVVSLRASERALRFAPVLAAVGMIADGVASLPLQAFRSMPDGSRRRVDLPSLFRKPAATGTRYDWTHQAMVSLLLRGNAYGLIVAIDSTGYPTNVEWLHPDSVMVDERSGRPTYFVNGRRVEASSILHVRGFTMPGSCVGLSPIEYYAMTVDAGLYAQKSSRDWYKNGQVPSADITITNDGEAVSAETARGFKDRYMAGVASGEPFVHGDNISIATIGVSAADAQWLDAVKANATLIAAIYKLAPEDIGGERGSSMTYSTTELDEIKFQSRTLRPWVTRLEQTFYDLTPRPVYLRFNFDANIRTEVKTRWETHQIALTSGARTINEIREIEDLPPVDWGSTPWPPPSVNRQPPGGTP